MIRTPLVDAESERREVYCSREYVRPLTNDELRQETRHKRRMWWIGAGFIVAFVVGVAVITLAVCFPRGPL